jgi:type I restriction enzyme R subunit
MKPYIPWLKHRGLTALNYKTRYKLFDFFGNYEYFEETFQYDEILKLPPLGQKTRQDPGEKPNFTAYENAAPDPVEMVREYGIGEQGMKIDRMLFQKFTETVTGDTTVQSLVDDDRWEQAAAYVMTHLLGKPTEFFTLEGLRKAAHVDRRVSMSEILERAFGRIERFKSKDELLEDEFRKFILTHQVEEVERLAAIRYYFKAYATNPSLREILDSRQLTKLNTNAALTTADYKAVPEPWRSQIPEYIKDYVLRDQFS